MTATDAELAAGLARLRRGENEALILEGDLEPKNPARVALAMLAEVQSHADGPRRALDRFLRYRALSEYTATAYLEGIAAKAAYDCQQWTVCNELLRSTLPVLPSPQLLDLAAGLVLRDRAAPDLIQLMRTKLGHPRTELARGKLAAIDEDEQLFSAIKSDLLTQFPKEVGTRYELESIEARYFPDRMVFHLPSEPDLEAQNLNAALAVDWALNAPRLYPNRSSLEAWCQRLARNIERLSMREHDVGICQLSRTPFALAYLSVDHLPQQLAWNRYLEILTHGVMPKYSGSRKHQKLRERPTHVAIISAHFRPSTVDNYFRRWYPVWRGEAERLSVVCLGEDNSRARELAEMADRYLRLDNHCMHLDRVLSFLAEEPIDLIFYPEVGMEPFVQLLASMRLASVQCCAWGHPVSSGLEAIDYYFSAATLEPEDAERHYTEKLITLPGIGTTFERAYWQELRSEQARVVRTKHSPKVQLVCAQNVLKWSPEFLAALAYLLESHPQAYLFSFVDITRTSFSAVRRVLRASWGNRADPLLHRIEFSPPVDLQGYRRVLLGADLMVDTFPYSGGQTAVDAAMLGLPFVALKGARMRHRQSAAILEFLGIPDLVADSNQTWLEKMHRLIEDESLRCAYREKLSQNAVKLCEDEEPLYALRFHARSLILHARSVEGPYER